MKITEYLVPYVDIKYYVGKMDNGYTVYVCPMKDKQTVDARFGARIGSLDRRFTVGGKLHEVPAGVAHFLEHKLFENSEGGNAFDLFSATGASANAFTSFDSTNYTFTSSVNAEESLRILLKFVTSPFFTPENVQKEIGIIAEEINMYDDSPDWMLSRLLLESLYSKHPVREDIAGTADSISLITPEILYDCYNAFYRPSNMMLAVSGGIDKDLVFDTAEELLGGIKEPVGSVESFSVDEPEDIVSPFSECEMPVAQSQLAVGYKCPPLDMKNDLAFRILENRRLAELICGDCSELYRDLYDGGLINETFGAEFLDLPGASVFSVSGESSDPEKTAAIVRKEIGRICREGFDSERVDELNRAGLGRVICNFDYSSSVTSLLSFSYFYNCSVCDIIDFTVDKERLDADAAAIFSENRSTAAVIRAGLRSI